MLFRSLKQSKIWIGAKRFGIISQHTYTEKLLWDNCWAKQKGNRDVEVLTPVLENLFGWRWKIWLSILVYWKTTSCTSGQRSSSSRRFSVSKGNWSEAYEVLVNQSLSWLITPGSCYSSGSPWKVCLNLGKRPSGFYFADFSDSGYDALDSKNAHFSSFQNLISPISTKELEFF